MIIAPTFSAREENTFGFTDSDFAAHCGGILIDDCKKIAECVDKTKSDAIVIMGAGDLHAKLNLL